MHHVGQAQVTQPATLRPLSLAELLDQTITIYRRNFLTYIGIVAVVQIPFSLLLLLYQLPARAAAATGPRPSLASTYGSLSVTLFLSVLVEAVAIAPTARAMFDQYQGQTIGVLEAYRRVGTSWLSLSGALAAATLFLLAVLGWSLVPVIGWATSLGIVLFYLGVIVPFLAPVVVLEGRGGHAALRRGWDLARRRFWAVAGAVAIIWLFVAVVLIGPDLLISLIAQRVLVGPLRLNSPVAPLPTSLWLAESLLALIVGLLGRPLQTIGKTLLYFDLRVRTEGLDLAWLTQPAGTPAAAAAGPATASAQAEGGHVVTWRELGNFVWLSLASCGGLIALGAVAVLLVLIIGFAGVGPR